MINILSFVVWSHPNYECRVHSGNNETKQPIHAMDLHTGCSNKNVPAIWHHLAADAHENFSLVKF